MPPVLWDRFGEVADALGTDRASLLREWIRWAVGESGAQPPRRPEQGRPASGR
jgi:hypothetical protein